MKVWYVILVLAIVLMPTASALTYVMNTEGQHTFNYTREGHITEGYPDIYEFHGEEGMLISIEINCPVSFHLSVRNGTGALIESHAATGHYKGNFTVSDSGIYKIQISTDVDTDYSITVDARSNLDDLFTVMQYAALGCTVCMVLVIAIVVAIVLLWRKKKNPPYTPPQAYNHYAQSPRKDGEYNPYEVK